MREVHKQLNAELDEVINVMRRNQDKKQKSINPVQKGDLVMLNGKDIRAKHRCKKLEDKMLRPFEVFSVRSNLRCCKLLLPGSSKICTVFNIKLLKKYHRTDMKEQVKVMESH
jgi:hypothetical protein